MLLTLPVPKVQVCGLGRVGGENKAAGQSVLTLPLRAALTLIPPSHLYPYPYPDGPIPISTHTPIHTHMALCLPTAHTPYG